MDIFSQQCLSAINQYRQLHQVPTLTLNPEISHISQAWADHLAAKNSFGHNSNASYKGKQLGENCAMNYRSDGAEYTGDQAAAQWYQEINDYNFSKHNGSHSGHFTQLVWKGSRECGFGRSRTSDGKWLVVANFYPAGNYLGQYQDNVFPPTFTGINAGGSNVGTGNTGYEDKLENADVKNTHFGSTNEAGVQISTEVHEETIGNMTKVVTIETKTYPDGRTERRRKEQIKNSSASGGHSNFKDDGANSFSSKNFPSRSQQAANSFSSNSGSAEGFSSDSNHPPSKGGTQVKREVREETSGSGPNAVTKVITIETTTYPDGRVETKRSEQTKSGSSKGFGYSGFGF